MIAVVGVSGLGADAIGYRVGVAVGVEANELGERTAGLQGDDAAERELAQEAVLGAIGGEVGDEAMADVLVGVGALERRDRTSLAGC